LWVRFGLHFNEYHKIQEAARGLSEPFFWPATLSVTNSNGERLFDFQLEAI
jgi:hypothetical protein